MNGYVAVISWRFFVLFVFSVCYGCLCRAWCDEGRKWKTNDKKSGRGRRGGHASQDRGEADVVV